MFDKCRNVTLAKTDGIRSTLSLVDILAPSVAQTCADFRIREKRGTATETRAPAIAERPS